jgi:hypothetical protein
MATHIVFNVELIYEGTGHYMDFEYEIEHPDNMPRDEAEEWANDLASGGDPELFNEIMANISIVPTVEHVEVDDESE